MKLRTLLVLLAGLAAALPDGDAGALPRECSSSSEYFEWLCTYNPIVGAWGPDLVKVGQTIVNCNNATISEGIPTDCVRETAAQCPGSVSECFSPDDPEELPGCPGWDLDCTGYFVPPRDRRGWVWANGIKGSFTLSPATSYNSMGGTNSVTNTSIGVYSVRFPGLGANDGNVQVAAYGSGNARCKVNEWHGLSTTEPGDLVVDVRCHAPDGTRVGSAFVVSFVATDDVSTATADVGYTLFFPGWLTAPQAKWSSAGPRPTETVLGTGYTRVRFDGQRHANPSVIVTAYGSDERFCQTVTTTVDATGTSSDVFCFDRYGNLVDSAFTMRYEWRQAPGPALSVSGYLLAHQPSSASYVAASQYNAAGATNTAQRSSAGVYTATYPLLAGKAGYAFTSTVMVSGATWYPLYCKVSSWGASGSSIIAGTHCFNYKGVATDGPYAQVFQSVPTY